MAVLHSVPDGVEKLKILSADAQYDLACACSSRGEEHRKRSADGRWIYPVALPYGGTTYLFKTLVSNACANDCRYCPLREERDIRRCALSPDETARIFMEYLRAGKVSGLFLSSGVAGGADASMERLVAAARILRKREKFRGYIHLKVLPGASEDAMREAASLASAVSINIEAPGEKHFRALSSKKNFLRDVVRPLKFISELAQGGCGPERVKQTTQFVVGASNETDAEIIRYAWGLYKRLNLQRVYFSAYQNGLGSPELPGERAPAPGNDLLTREHRLYQTDWLIRKYGFSEDEIPFGADGNLSLEADPKEIWAKRHPECFPVNVNTASREELLRVPGLGFVTVKRVIEARAARRLRSMTDIGRAGARLQKAAGYLTF
ncbi:MAG TPA: radical SAM protein [Planctomycetes bacterium]|nr:radical SAM protein [Planctomycetota bacterium]